MSEKFWVAANKHGVFVGFIFGKDRSEIYMKAKKLGVDVCRRMIKAHSSDDCWKSPMSGRRPWVDQ